MYAFLRHRLLFHFPVAVLCADNQSLAIQIQDEEAQRGHAQSFQDDTLSHVLDGVNIEFLEYNIDEQSKRLTQMKELEREVVEVAEMFKDLQVMVNEQQESLDIIDANITQTKEKTDNALKNLQSVRITLLFDSFVCILDNVCSSFLLPPYICMCVMRLRPISARPASVRAAASSWCSSSSV